jgi:hypothetical protein
VEDSVDSREFPMVRSPVSIAFIMHREVHILKTYPGWREEE